MDDDTSLYGPRPCTSDLEIDSRGRLKKIHISAAGSEAGNQCCVSPVSMQTNVINTKTVTQAATPITCGTGHPALCQLATTVD
ncbi:hypothetical protein C0Q70_10020 [Pomacea canaliculata]|uniref:Uncharacterized protein n=1 Tax=Pomacea canaliculata TaxID=400727 RepID=A0A2T7PBE7_POMCA|nr:hypothetical protein C0Q70_10020 [Pomacea canaliculata]